VVFFVDCLKQTRIELPQPQQLFTWPLLIRRVSPAIFLLVLATASLWWRCTAFDFVFDDHAQIQANPRIQSVVYLKELVTQPLWEQLGPGRASHYYRPAFSLLLLSQYLAFGLDPGPWHLTSLILYILVVLSVFLLLLLLFEMVFPAFAGSLLFAVLPIHAEVVSWVSASDESLFSLFLVLSLCSLILADKATAPRRRVGWLLLSSCLFAVSLFSKETAIGAGLSLVVFGLIPSHRRKERAISACLVYLIPATVYMIVRWLVLRGTTLPVEPRPFLSVLSLLPSLAMLTIRQLFWPVNTSLFYDVHAMRSGWVIFAWLAALLLAGIYQAYRKAPISLGILALLISPLLPWFAALFYLSDSALFQNRYLYLPTLAAAVLLAFLLTKTSGHPPIQWVFSVGVLVLCAALAAAARRAMSPYQNDISLFRRAVSLAPQNVLAWGLLAEAEARIGDDHNAESFYKKAVLLRSDLWETNFHLAMNDLRHGRANDASESLRKSLASQYARPGERALSWYEMGKIEAAQGRVTDAEHSFLQAEKLEPSSKKVHAELARLTEGHSARQPN